MTQPQTDYDNYEDYVDQLSQLRAFNWVLYLTIEGGDDFAQHSSGVYGILEGLTDKLEKTFASMNNYEAIKQPVKLHNKTDNSAIIKTTPFHEYFNLDKATGQPLPDEQPSTKHLEVREQLIAASYKQGHSIGDIAQAVNLKKQHIEKVLLGLAVKGELPERVEDQALAASQ